MNAILKSVLLRTLRAGIAGACASMILVLPNNINDFTDLQKWLTSLSIAGLIGLITGIIMGLDKAIRSK